MDRSRYFIILAFGVLLGAAVEYMKDVNPQTAKLARIARLEALMDGGKVVYQPFGKRSSIHSKTIHGEVAGLDAAPAEKSEEAIKPPAKKEDDKKKKDEKKKKDDKKKKKKKKTIKGKGEDSPKDDSDDDQAKSGDEVMPFVAAAGFRAKQAADENKEPETVEEWLAILMPSPDLDKTTKFVTQFQNGAIAYDIYYEVVTTMLEDERVKMRELAVMALGSTPSSKSFTMLAEFTAAEPGLTAPKTQANAYLRMYTRLEYVNHLTGAFNSGSVEASLQAFEFLKQAAQKWLKPAPSEDPTQQDTTPRVPASNVSRYFTNVITALEHLAATTQNQTLQSGANSTLETIRPLMAGTETPVSPQASN